MVDTLKCWSCEISNLTHQCHWYSAMTLLIDGWVKIPVSHSTALHHQKFRLMEKELWIRFIHNFCIIFSSPAPSKIAIEEKGVKDQTHPQFHINKYTNKQYLNKKEDLSVHMIIVIRFTRHRNGKKTNRITSLFLWRPDLLPLLTWNWLSSGVLNWKSSVRDDTWLPLDEVETWTLSLLVVVTW